jgi:hypothetical protein
MNTHDELEPGQATLLDLKLDALRRELAGYHAPEALEAALLARFAEQRRAAKKPRLWWMPPLALAATLALVSWMVMKPVPGTGFTSPVPGTGLGEADPGPFLALKPLERIALEPGTTMVTTEFPRALLADWGLPVSPERAGEPVRAEMLYSADGEPIAVRLLN